ncbi:MAG TPA: hypothetical protein VHR45_09330 [Thermoanaerobaculia bacterium]|nr:hypothetical protein [Thermoanaerobaculia bacterium]
MNKSRKSHQITRRGKAAFRVGAEDLRGGRADLLLDETLARVFGGSLPISTVPAACTAYSCSQYAPPP